MTVFCVGFSCGAIFVAVAAVTISYIGLELLDGRSDVL